MLTDTELAIVLVYPELLGTYGDRGNAVALVRRAGGRGIRARVVEVPVGEPLPSSADVYLVGGSEDAAQVLALRSFRATRGGAEALHGRAPCLAVCAGFQILSRCFTTGDGHREPGLGLLDVDCGRLPRQRAVGEVLAEGITIPGLPTLTGYENHQGDAVLGPRAAPLGRVVVGVGNGHEATEGAVQDNIVATYLHGPVLVRNPALADHLLERSMGPLPAYDDEAVEQLRRERLAAARPHRHLLGRR
jgi:CobQ-like glutamine amidotransferase family enzyme